MSKQAPTEHASVANPLPTFAEQGGLPRLRSMIHAQPVGPGRINDDERAFLELCRDRMTAALRPATADQIAAEIEALLSHYPLRSVNPRIAERVAADWISDLGHLPPDIVAAACAAYRRSGERQAPTPGMILALANPIAEARRFLARQADRLLTPIRLPHAAG